MSKLPLSFLQSSAMLLGHGVYQLGQANTIKNSALNLKIALPELSEQQFKYIHKQASLNEVKSYCEFISIWGSSKEKNISRIHHVTGEHYLHEAIAKEKGLVLIIPHFGTWEILNSWLGQYTTLTIMYKPSKNATADTFVKAARSREHAHLVPTNEIGVKEIFKALKKGGSTVILPDHSPDHGTDLTPWFGVPLYSSHLSAKLIQKTKASALLIYAIRNDNAGFDITLKPIDERIYAPEHGTDLIHAAVENLIRTHPEHYHWSYKRFQASPETRGLYDKPQQVALDIIQKIKQTP